MYIPPHFAESRIDVLHDLIGAHPLATLVTTSPRGIDANHIPLQLSKDAGAFGCLRGHVARANPLWRDIAADTEALAIFHGPASYISPSWYATKKAHGKVVPTWNYVVVHAYGALRVVDDPAWLRRQLEALTAENEASFAAPWSVAQAPPEYLERMAAAIVGIEMVVTRLVGKWKLSQNQPAENRAGVVAGLAQRGETALAALVAAAADPHR
ncbi:MAG: FMN-binding negative transcriptional regulator [Rhodocyclaceae bacterium]|nr:FMN-binding negative transcriptional regulator [Rhodocyclaceae bacterium]